MAKLRLIQFSGEGCPPCEAMAKARTVQRFADRHRRVVVESYFLPLAAGLAEARHAERQADKYRIDAVPTQVFETEAGVELGRFEGGMSLRMLEEAYEDALARVPPVKRVKRRRLRPA